MVDSFTPEPHFTHHTGVYTGSTQGQGGESGNKRTSSVGDPNPVVPPTAVSMGF